jgi:glutamyl-tRNA synthetase
MLRVRFAPSPTGFLHIGSARTFIFNWLYARRHGGTMILRIDDTDVLRNTQASLDSIFEGLKWLNLSWDEFYRQSERTSLYDEVTASILARGMAYRDFTPPDAETESGDRSKNQPWLFNPGMRELSQEESDRRAAAGEKFAVRFRVPRDEVQDVTFTDLVYGQQSKSTADIEDFALVRSDGMPTYHLASCADDVDLRISTVVRGQDHLSNTFKHILIFEAAGAEVPQFAHLPLLIAPDGSKLSKRKHGPVVSVTTYRDLGFLPQAFVNFVCLLGWSPKDNREQMSLLEMLDSFSFEGVNRSNAVINFSDADPVDPKAAWLNSQHLRTMPIDELLPYVKGVLTKAGLPVPPDDHLAQVVDLIRARFFYLTDFVTRGRAYFSDDFPIEGKAIENLEKPGAREGLHELADRIAAAPEFTEASVEAELRKLAEEKGLKPGVLINAARAALTGQSVGPSAFHVFTAIGKDRVVARLRAA